LKEQIADTTMDMTALRANSGDRSSFHPPQHDIKHLLLEEKEKRLFVQE